MYTIPSLKTLVAAFGAEKGRELRSAFEGQRDRNPFSTPKLGAANAILNGDGVEYVEVGDTRFAYVNLGDTYQQTICRVNGRLRVASWGDVYESLGG